MLTPSVILCVDDEGSGLMARSLFLSKAGYDVIPSADGEAALKMFRRYHIDLVITDHFLPGATGTKVAEDMKRFKPKVPIVLFTGALDPPSGSEHADLVLTKGSMDPPAFLAAIAKLVTKRQSAGIRDD